MAKLLTVVEDCISVVKDKQLTDFSGVQSKPVNFLYLRHD